MPTRFLKPQPLTSEVFAPYGEVIGHFAAGDRRTINYGNTIRFHDLARLDLEANHGTPLVSIFRSKPLQQPIFIKVMERHPLSSQAFYPLSARPYLVVVAGDGEFRAINIEAFLAGPTQGVNYRRGIWHHYSLALGEVSDFLVIDRGGPEKNCDEIFLEEEVCVVF
jgi:ureidoglycolate lyase